MTTIAADQAKSGFEKLLCRTAQGEEFVITEHGTPVARLLPMPSGHQRGEAMTLEELRKFREGITLGPDLTIRQLIDEGRKL